MLQSDLSPGPFRKGGQGGFMQLPADFNKMAPLIPLYERGKHHAYVELTLN